MMKPFSSDTYRPIQEKTTHTAERLKHYPDNISLEVVSLSLQFYPSNRM